MPSGKKWLLEVPYEQRSLASSKGARWQAELGWVFTGTVVPESLCGWLPKPYSWASFQQQDLDGKALGHAAGSYETGQVQLRDDQEQDRDRILDAWEQGAPEFLLASDVGCGKTYTVLAAIRRLEDVRNILIISPLSVVPHWRRSLEAIGDGGRRFCVINYESIQKLVSKPAAAHSAKRKSTKNRRTAKSGTGKIAWDVIICDESHYLTNPSSQRSQLVERIIAGPAGSPAWPIRMSATAGSNPAEMAYLHRGLFWATGKKPLTSITMDKYAQWCAEQRLGVSVDRWDKLKWEKDKGDLERIRRMLLDTEVPWAVRRRPEDWPEQQRIPTPVELSPEEMMLYERAWGEFKHAMRDIEKSVKSGQVSVAQKQAAGLAAQLRYRQKAGLLRAPHTTNFILDLLNKGLQVAVSCEFIDCVETISNGLRAKHVPVSLFTGRNRVDRETQRVRFQLGTSKVILFTPAEGFSLHAGEQAINGNQVPRATVIAEPRWSPKKSLQIEGRAHRDGQHAPCYYCYAENTIERRVVDVLVDGISNTKTMVGDDISSLTALAETLNVPFIAA